MAYITNADIELRLGSAAYVQLTDDDGNGVADTPVVDEARLAGEGEVNGYLARRFLAPIDVSTHAELADVLKSVTLDVVEYRLRLRRPPVSGDTRRRYEQTLAWLRGVAEGRIELPASSGLEANAALGTTAASAGEARLLTHDELRGN
jgi:phage gp36-like protein